MSPGAVAVVLAVWIGEVQPGVRSGNDEVADVLVLRDGAAVRGEVVESSPRAGTLTVIVRREWAKKHAARWLERWEKVAAPGLKAGIVERRDRLTAWRRERAAGAAGGGDPVRDWIDRELTRLQPGRGDASESPLLVVRLSRGDVRALTRAPAGRTRLLRLAWAAKLADPENLKADGLTEALEGRGYDPASKTPVVLDALLPLQPETEAAWLVHRAATEVAHDQGLRFIRYGSVVMPEPAAGQPLNLGAGLDAVAAIKDLLGENAADPLPPKLREVEGRGRVGALVTSLEMAADMASVDVEIALWVRQTAGRWVVSGSRSARVRPDELGQNAGVDLAADPQVALAFKVVEGLGFGAIDPDMKRRTLGIGAATRKALGLARAAAETDIAALALRVTEPVKAPAPAAKPKP